MSGWSTLCPELNEGDLVVHREGDGKYEQLYLILGDKKFLHYTSATRYHLTVEVPVFQYYALNLKNMIKHRITVAPQYNWKVLANLTDGAKI